MDLHWQQDSGTGGEHAYIGQGFCSASLFRAAEQGHDGRQQWHLSCSTHSIQDSLDVSRSTCLLVLMLHAMSHCVLMLQASHSLPVITPAHDVTC